MRLKTTFFTTLILLLLSISSIQADEILSIVAPTDGVVKRVELAVGAWVYSGDTIVSIKAKDGSIIKMRAGEAGKLINLEVVAYDKVNKGDVLGMLRTTPIIADSPLTKNGSSSTSMSELAGKLFNTTGAAALIHGQSLSWTEGLGRVLMISVGLLLLYLFFL
jgi:oxaloacetate decarboxylase beta subunit